MEVQHLPVVTEVPVQTEAVTRVPEASVQMDQAVLSQVALLLTVAAVAAVHILTQFLRLDLKQAVLAAAEQELKPAVKVHMVYLSTSERLEVPQQMQR